MRREVFDMERDVLEVGDEVSIVEGRLPAAYYYTVEPALAMSRNYKNAERIKSRKGIVAAKERHASSIYVYIEFDE